MRAWNDTPAQPALEEQPLNLIQNADLYDRTDMNRYVRPSYAKRASMIHIPQPSAICCNGRPQGLGKSKRLCMPAFPGGAFGIGVGHIDPAN